MTLRRLLAAALTGSVALLAGCGSSSAGAGGETASQLFHRAVHVLASARSARMVGTVDSGGRGLSIDMVLYRNGDSEGTFGETGSTGDLVVAGGTTYIKGSEAFWEGLAGATGSSVTPAEKSEFAKLAGRWVESSLSESGLVGFTLTSFASSLSKKAGTLSKVGTRRIHGEMAVGIKGSNQGTIWVATSGTAYPLEVSKTVNGKTQSVEFSDWNSATAVTAPRGAESIEQIVGG